MKKCKSDLLRWAVLTVAQFICVGRLAAVPSSPHAVIAEQPDGSKVALRIKGDEHFNWQEDLNGYTVVQDKNRTYVYAREITNFKAFTDNKSELVVGQADPKAAGLKKHILPPTDKIMKWRRDSIGLHDEANSAKRVAPQGAVKNIVILMRFKNHAQRTLPSEAEIDKLFNAPGGDPQIAPTGSVRDFYRENSYGKMDLTSTVFTWVDLPKTEAYYADGTSGDGPKMHEAIRDALKAADSQINFKQFDQDQDGWVDAIAFIHSGYGAEWGGTDADGVPHTNRIWSHRWGIPTWTSAEGIKVSPYHISPALWSTSGSAPGRIGVICHETGHFFGLPDLYDQTDPGEGLGSWCLMANSWGFDGSQYFPPHMSAWCKANLKWLTPEELTASTQGCQLPPLATTPKVFKISKGYPTGEYLLLENRQPIGFDSGIPAGVGGRGGLIVHHVDEKKFDNNDNGFPSQAGWPQNNKHYKIAVLQADGKFDLEMAVNRGDGDDPFRLGHATKLDSATVPNLNAYQDGAVIKLDHVISDLASASADLTFNYSDGTAPPPVEPGDPTETAAWTVMVFMNGDNNLEPFALQDFAEMASVDSGDNVNVVVQFDRAPSFSNEQGDWEQTLRFLVKEGMQPTVGNALEDLGEVNMGDGGTLADFVTWSRDNYPAERYMLVIWDHGQGWRVRQATSLPEGRDKAAKSLLKAQLAFRNGLPWKAPVKRPDQDWQQQIPLQMVSEGPVRYVSSDDTSNDHLFNREIQDSLLSSLDGERLDVIGFDACLMAMIETGYALREVGDVMVASEELEPGAGWNYAKLLKPLAANPAMNAEELGALVVRAYEEEYASNDPQTTLSAVRLGKMQSLSGSVSKFGDSLRNRLVAEKAMIRAARDNCAAFAPGYGLHGIDLDRFCELVAAQTSNNTLKQRANTVRARLKAAVIANYVGDDRQGDFGSKGLAIYFPQTQTQFNFDPDQEGYLETNLNWPVQFVQQHKWDNFLQAYFAANP